MCSQLATLKRIRFLCFQLSYHRYQQQERTPKNEVRFLIYDVVGSNVCTKRRDLLILSLSGRSIISFGNMIGRQNLRALKGSKLRILESTSRLLQGKASPNLNKHINRLTLQPLFQ